MGFFDFFTKRKQEKPIVSIKVVSQDDPQATDPIPFHEEEYRNALRLYDEAHADGEYQRKLTRFFDLLNNIRETYSVINSVGSFCDDAGDRLVESCVEAIALEAEIREKREYYENTVFDMSEPYKTLAMVYEKRGEYQRAATMCVLAIENGYPNDGTKSGMRGRLARMIKKGDLPLTDNLKKILGL